MHSTSSGGRDDHGGMNLGNSFRVGDALAGGIRPGSLRSTALATPFHGVRSLVEPSGVRERCLAYTVKMRADAAFTGVTAAQLWGIPLPNRVLDDRLEVTVPHASPRPLGRGIRGRQHDPRLVEIVEVDGLRVLSPASCGVALGAILPMPDLVAAGDYLVTSVFGDPRPPMCTVDDLRLAFALGRRSGAPRLREALALIQSGPLSRPESLARVLFVTAGLPHPIANLRISPLLMFDLAWPNWRVGFDYHGDHHRSASQHARDVGRLDVARRDGWALVQATKNDLFAQPFDLIGRVRGRLIERGAVIRPVHPSKMARLEP